MRLSAQDRTLLCWVTAITVFLLIPLPVESAGRRWPALVRDLVDFAHPVAFAWLSHLAFVGLRIRIPAPSAAPYWWVLAAAAGYGLLTEAVQSLVGRNSDPVDLLNDVLGAGFALLLHARAEGRSPPRRSGFAVLAAIAAILVALPLASTLAAYASRASGDPKIWKGGNLIYSRLARWQDARYSGLVINDVRGDWRGWNHLEITVENRQAQSLPVMVIVRDRYNRRIGRDRFHHEYRLPPHSVQTLRIPVAEIHADSDERRVDTGAMDSILILSDASQKIPDFAVREVRLAL